MKCFSCAAKLEKGFTTHTVELEKGVVIIRHVPCLKCTECGEIFYDDDVIESLEKIVEDARKISGEIFVAEYSKHAA